MISIVGQPEVNEKRAVKDKDRVTVTQVFYSDPNYNKKFKLSQGKPLPL